MIKRIFSMAALSLMVAACGGGDDAAGEGETVKADTSVTTVQGTDTVNQPTEVQTTDSVVTTTTVTQDTVQGQTQAQGTATTTDSAQH